MLKAITSFCSQRALFIHYASVASPPHTRLSAAEQVRACVLPAEISPLLRELNRAKRASQREHKFSIIFLLGGLLFPSSPAAAEAAFDCRALVLPSFCLLGTLKTPSRKTCWLSAAIASRHFPRFCSWHTMWKNSIKRRPCWDCRGRCSCSCRKWCAHRLDGFLFPF